MWLSPFDLFVTFKYVKITWERLKVKYGVNDATKKKYVVVELLQFQTTDDKPIMEQIHVYENLCAEVLSENIMMYKIL